ncbi:DNA-binding HxlR family transcriptional regulator [Altererythrobacter atlanticus]|uniref:HTH-type transcriptional regulator YodB n=1 Tax=Croceibacterium atlanticum TaxID=1267766 RepID=A0A0F7KNH0_9SPHN|nr:helix-turn-helix domain-containing protein [Croceibacterium atlanticum]AKH42063.1 HTH-type transcriptional regulator YodB [Croceibacterium atlanticum]MBB5733368.1 DNA-binding HxlR family transcriptional regulator [Croceibacterium atlanticum]
MKLQKETAVHGKWYQDACGAAFAFELLGERWSLLIVREMMLGPRRFSELRASLPGLSARVLTERLEGLQASGLLQKRMLPPPASVQVYELTEWGYAAQPAMLELCRWSVRSPAHDPTLHLSPTALMLSLKAMYDPEAGQHFTGQVGFAVSGSEFVAELGEKGMSVRRGDAEQGRVTFRAELPLPLLRAFYGKAPPEMLEQSGQLEIGKERYLAEAVISKFVFPEKIVPPE